MKDLGEVKKILRMEINIDRAKGKLCLTQKQYLKKILQCFGMHGHSKPVDTSLTPHLKLNKDMSPKDEEE